MKKSIADQQRKALVKFMASRGLKQSSWCKKANISEGSLRNFLNGDSDSMQSNQLQMLAQAADTTIAEILGVPTGKVDSEDAILYALKELIDIVTNKKPATNEQMLDDFIYASVHYRDSGQLNAASVMKSLVEHVKASSLQEKLKKDELPFSLSPPRSGHN